MHALSKNPPPPWFALVLGVSAWALAMFCLSLALRFRFFPAHGSEADIGVGIVVVLSVPLLVASAVFALPRQVSSLWRFFLVSPSILAIVALCVAFIGVSARP